MELLISSWLVMNNTENAMPAMAPARVSSGSDESVTILGSWLPPLGLQTPIVSLHEAQWRCCSPRLIKTPYPKSSQNVSSLQIVPHPVELVSFTRHCEAITATLRVDMRR